MEITDVIPAKRKTNGFWSRIGGGSLLIAALFHGILLIAGGFWILQVVHDKPEKKIDFMPPGGGGGERGAEHQIQRKKQVQITPSTNVKRVFAEGVQSDFSIPEQGDSFGELSSLSSLGGGGMSGGMGSSGDGKGFGRGVGNTAGLGGGGTLGIKLFGMDLNVKSIGVVLDVSGSMTQHLKRVVDEVNRVAPGSPVILHVGCGVGDGRGEKRIEPVGLAPDRFKRFWYLHQDKLYREQQEDRRAKVDFSRPLPSPPVYELLANRPKTFFYEYEGTKFAGNALLANELKAVEAVYCFADFQDRIVPEEAEKIRQALTRRKQKLFIHASAKGDYLTNARELIAIPTGGSQLQTPKP